MERIRELDRYQKGILLLLIALAAVFCVIYSITTSRVGLLYEDTILVPGEMNGNTVYSGRIHGQESAFTVTADQTVTFQWGGQFYGPYRVISDSTAVPKDHDYGQLMRGIEVREGDTIIFRGGILDMGGYWMRVNEDGTNASFTVTAVLSDGTEIDENGNVIDPMRPSVSDILYLLDGPVLTHKGTWTAWLCGVFLSVLNAVSIVFAEELFRWNLKFQIRNADFAEPSEWELATRYIGWTVLTIMILVIYIVGLQ